LSCLGLPWTCPCLVTALDSLGLHMPAPSPPQNLGWISLAHLPSIAGPYINLYGHTMLGHALDIPCLVPWFLVGFYVASCPLLGSPAPWTWTWTTWLPLVCHRIALWLSANMCLGWCQHGFLLGFAGWMPRTCWLLLRAAGCLRLASCCLIAFMDSCLLQVYAPLPALDQVPPMLQVAWNTGSARLPPRNSCPSDYALMDCSLAACWTTPALLERLARLQVLLGLLPAGLPPAGCLDST